MPGRKQKMKMILKPNWIIHEKNMDDYEYQSYVLMDAEKKFFNKINNKKLDNFSEIIFHFLNMNTMLSKLKLHDQNLREYKSEKIIEFVDDFTRSHKSKKTKTPCFSIATHAKNVFMSVLEDYMDLALAKLGNIKFVMKNKHIKQEDVIYVILHATSCDIYDLWKIDLTKESFGTIQRIDSFEWKDGVKEGFKEFIVEYNGDPKNDTISEDNTMIVTMGMADDHKNLVTLAKDIIILNRLFVPYDIEFNENVIWDIKDTTEDQNIFPYTLVTD